MNRVTPEERYYACFLNQYGVSINNLATELGRTWTTTQRMIDPEKVRAKSRDYYENNKETVLNGIKRYSKTEKGRATAKRYEQSAKGRKKDKRYRSSENGLAKDRGMKAKRRAWKWGSIFEVDGQVVDMTPLIKNDPVGQSFFIDPRADNAFNALLEEAKRLEEQTGIVYHVDHLVPLSRGGEHSPENFQLITAEENLRKHNQMIPEDWAIYCRRIFNIP